MHFSTPTGDHAAIANLVDWNPRSAIVMHDKAAADLMVAARPNAEAEYDKAEEASDAVGSAQIKPQPVF